MKNVKKSNETLLIAGFLIICCSFLTGKTFAHCDTVSGPVISEAKIALEKRDVTTVLKWVKKENEPEIKAAFAKTVKVRAMNSEAKELSDQYFFETLVRLHRIGEGASYSGIKDEPVEPIVAMADKALIDGSADGIIRKISEHMGEAIREKFNKVLQTSENKDKSVEAGREYVEAYVTYMHFVEGIHAAIMSAGGHQAESGAHSSVHKD